MNSIQELPEKYHELSSLNSRDLTQTRETDKNSKCFKNVIEIEKKLVVLKYFNELPTRDSQTLCFSR